MSFSIKPAQNCFVYYWLRIFSLFLFQKTNFEWPGVLQSFRDALGASYPLRLLTSARYQFYCPSRSIWQLRYTTHCLHGLMLGESPKQKKAHIKTSALTSCFQLIERQASCELLGIHTSQNTNIIRFASSLVWLP